VKASHRVSAVFDDSNLVSAAGLVPLLRLAESAGLHRLLVGLTVPAANAAVKAVCVIAGMLAGADSIDDLDLLRHGAMRRVFSGVRAPSTFGTHLRSFTHGHVQQLDAIAAKVLAGLAVLAPGLLAGSRQPEGIAFLDVDDTIREVHGHAKQGAAFGYSGIRGLNAQLAVLSTPIAAPVILRARLRSGNTISHRGAGRLLARAIKTARAAGVASRVLVRADSAYYVHTFVAAAVRAKAWFSVTARMNKQVTAAIAAIPDQAWTPIRYPNAVFDEAEGRWISEAEVAEAPLTVFTSRRMRDHVTCRLVVRRVKRLNPTSGDGTRQGELFAAYRHHAFITNSTLSTVEADARHRDHAVVEQVIAELKQGSVAHLPSGSYAANAAWLAHAVIAFNLARTAGVLASTRHARARWATLRTHLINVPARVASSAGKPCTSRQTGPGPTPGRATHGRARPTPHHRDLTTSPTGHDQGPEAERRADRRNSRAHARPHCSDPESRPHEINAGGSRLSPHEHLTRKETVIMLRSLITSLIAVPLAAATTLTAPAAHADPAVHGVYVEEYDAYEHLAAGENFCVPWSGQFHEVRSGLAKLLTPSGTRRPGEVHINLVVDGFVELIPDDAAFPTYSGTYREKADGVLTGLTGDGDVERVMQWRLRTTLEGTDGSTLTLSMSGKLNTNGNDDVVVSRDSFSCA